MEKISMKLLNVRAMVIQDRVYFLLSKYVIIGPESDSTENDCSAIDNEANPHVSSIKIQKLDKRTDVHISREVEL